MQITSKNYQQIPYHKNLPRQINQLVLCGISI